MACSGAHCTNHFAGCSYHRPPCPSNRPLMSGQPTQGTRVQAVHVENLRQNIQAEISLYRSNPNYAWVPMEANVAAGDFVDENDMWTELDRMMDRVLGWSGDLPNQYGQYLTWVQYVALCNEYEYVRTNCICHADLGTQVCTCHNDCGCHYSDMRLKKEIQYC